MDLGKAAAQACHAARLSLLRFLQHHPDRAAEFLAKNSAGTVVVLDAPCLRDLDYVAVLASRHDLPWALFVDSGHVLPPHFDRSPIPTALAIGPADKRRIKPLVRRYSCLKGDSL
jgi:peptidyl-tRNA hydrolase